MDFQSATIGFFLRKFIRLVDFCVNPCYFQPVIHGSTYIGTYFPPPLNMGS